MLLPALNHACSSAIIASSYGFSWVADKATGLVVLMQLQIYSFFGRVITNDCVLALDHFPVLYIKCSRGHQSSCRNLSGLVLLECRLCPVIYQSLVSSQLSLFNV